MAICGRKQMFCEEKSVLSPDSKKKKKTSRIRDVLENDEYRGNDHRPELAHEAQH